MKKFLIFTLIALAGAISSCSKSSDGGDSSSSTGKYYVVVTGSDGVVIKSAAIAVDGTTHSVTDIDSQNWKSDKYSASNFSCSVTAEGNDKSSRLTLQLLKDGKVLNKSTATGTVLVATISN